MLRNTFAVLAVLAIAASAANAAPIVTMSEGSVGGFKSLDFFYSASAGAEFTNYRLNVVSSNGTNLQDPVKADTTDAGSNAVDTFMNSVYSLFALGNPTFNFNVYKPVGIGSDIPPRDQIDWSVLDSGTQTGDSNSFDPGTGTVNAPFHLARVLVSPEGFGTATFTAFDNQSQGVGTVFNFEYGIIPEPATVSLLGLAIVGGLGYFRRRR